MSEKAQEILITIVAWVLIVTIVYFAFFYDTDGDSLSPSNDANDNAGQEEDYYPE